MLNLHGERMTHSRPNRLCRWPRAQHSHTCVFQMAIARDDDPLSFGAFIHSLPFVPSDAITRRRTT
jgi:hypothetical protein